METSTFREIQRLRSMTVGQLQVRWLELYGEESRSRNREFLFRRLAWRVQEIANGGLSDHARGRIAELAPDGFMRAVTPPTLASSVAVPESPELAPGRTVRDQRLPSPGTVLTRQYHGREIRVVAIEDGNFEWNGRVYHSLSEVARAVTGQHWSGPFFFGLRRRTRKS